MSLYSADRPRRGLGSGHWLGWVLLVLALILFFSPWLLAFAMPGGAGGAAPASRASWDSWICSIALILVAGFAILRPQLWEVWVGFVLGIWLFIAPFALGFTNVLGATLTHCIVGALMAIASAVTLGTMRAAPMQWSLRRN